MNESAERLRAWMIADLETVLDELERLRRLTDPGRHRPRVDSNMPVVSDPGGGAQGTAAEASWRAVTEACQVIPPMSGAQPVLILNARGDILPYSETIPLCADHDWQNFGPCPAIPTPFTACVCCGLIKQEADR